ncbi:MAG: hypothetical protein LCH96_00135 [Actinobacteria bacterium]|nr:hypothetical protein [Actinomycetota bacterium]
MTAQPLVDEFGLLGDALARCLDAIETCAVPQANQCGWGTWELDQRGEPLALSAARPALYDGNAGIAWALRTLGRDDGLAPAGGSDGIPGLLGGSAGADLAAGVAPRPDLAGRGYDLGGGLAGDLLALVRTGSGLAVVTALVDAIAAGARWDGEGCCWPDVAEGEVLCGLAHGVSGVVLALAEAMAAFPVLSGRAAPLIAGGLRWEAAWFDPVSGGWPDLRGDGPASYPVLWCHGAAGVAAVRLRLVQLGLDLDYPAEAIAAEAHTAVLACGRELTRAAALARTGGFGVVPGGLTLCHGLGGPLDVLVLAAEVWDEPGHLHAARRIASDLLVGAPEDPLDWPSGLRADGCLGLFVGTAGTALLLARLLEPARVGSLSLLAF